MQASKATADRVHGTTRSQRREAIRPGARRRISTPTLLGARGLPPTTAATARGRQLLSQCRTLTPPCRRSRSTTRSPNQHRIDPETDPRGAVRSQRQQRGDALGIALRPRLPGCQQPVLRAQQRPHPANRHRPLASAGEGSGLTKPLSPSYDDLLAMPSISVIRAIECAGNGRNFFQQFHGRRIEGTP